ncbi:hypothetical protein SCLCIDRAFT_141699, partial [Scleroderma citrinum Foug A]
CRCNDAKVPDRHLQLLKFDVFPSSVIKPQTAFTFDMLDHFLIYALECKLLPEASIKNSADCLIMPFQIPFQ